VSIGHIAGQAVARLARPRLAVLALQVLALQVLAPSGQRPLHLHTRAFPMAEPPRAIDEDGSFEASMSFTWSPPNAIDLSDLILA
jgi:hypothetical protein